MPSRPTRNLVRLLAGCAALLCIAGVQPAAAQASPAASASTTTMQSTTPQGTTSQSKVGAGGPSQGVQINGWWKIDVKNADGTLVRHVEFENALVGAGLLAKFVAGQATPGALAISAASPTTDGPCNYGKQCLIYQNGTANYADFVQGSSAIPYCGQGRSCSSDLAVSEDGKGGVVLAGSVTAAGSGTITAVGTNIASCDAGTTLSDCRSVLSLSSLTARTLTQPLAVDAGQIVQFTVTLSFSSI